MYTIPYADHWILVLNSEDLTLSYYPTRYTNDVMQVNVPTQGFPPQWKQFTIDCRSFLQGFLQMPGSNMILVGK